MDRNVLRLIVGSQILMAVAILGIVILVWAKAPGALSQGQNGWWTERTAAKLGSIGGPVIGLLGGLIGTLGGCGVARRFVLTLTAAVVGLGAVSLVVGLIAVGSGQPYAVYFPLLLGGIITSAVLGPIFFLLRWAYAQRELRKMAAMDAGLTDSQHKQQP